MFRKSLLTIVGTLGLTAAIAILPAQAECDRFDRWRGDRDCQIEGQSHRRSRERLRNYLDRIENIVGSRLADDLFDAFEDGDDIDDILAGLNISDRDVDRLEDIFDDIDDLLDDLRG